MGVGPIGVGIERGVRSGCVGARRAPLGDLCVASDIEDADGTICGNRRRELAIRGDVAILEGTPTADLSAVVAQDKEALARAVAEE